MPEEKMRMVKINGKRANLLSAWWILVIIIIGSGLVAGTLLFFFNYANVSLAESEILANNLARCIFEKSVNANEVLDENTDFLNECSINSELFTGSSRYFVKINVDYSDSERTDFVKKYGANAYEKDCEITHAKIKTKYFSQCDIKKIKVPDEKGGADVEITASSKSSGRQI